MSREYDLLFGVFCVQLGKISPARLVLGTDVRNTEKETENCC
ncbi:MAG: hypothetical protein VCB26_00260 [Candidatus Hydrogenedentota bacterium]